jgi:hypothetical protein
MERSQESFSSVDAVAVTVLLHGENVDLAVNRFWEEVTYAP